MVRRSALVRRVIEGVVQAGTRLGAPSTTGSTTQASRDTIPTTGSRAARQPGYTTQATISEPQEAHTERQKGNQSHPQKRSKRKDLKRSTALAVQSPTRPKAVSITRLPLRPREIKKDAVNDQSIVVVEEPLTLGERLLRVRIGAALTAMEDEGPLTQQLGDLVLAHGRELLPADTQQLLEEAGAILGKTVINLDEDAGQVEDATQTGETEGVEDGAPAGQDHSQDHIEGGGGGQNAEAATQARAATPTPDQADLNQKDQLASKGLVGNVGPGSDQVQKRAFGGLVFKPPEFRVRERRGSRLHKPNPLTRRIVRVLAACGIPQDAITEIIDIDKATLAKHYRYELDNGLHEVNARVAHRLYSLALHGSGKEAVTAMIFWLKTRAGYREADRLEIDVTGTVQHEHTALTHEERANRLLQLLNPGAAGGAGQSDPKR